MNWLRPRIGNARGSAVLETMAVLPTLLFLMLGVCEFSRAWLTLDLVTTAAREGARRGVVTPTSAGKVFNSGPALARIDAMITDPKLNMTRTVTCATPCSSSTNSQVQATVTVTFNTVIPVILPFLSGVTLTQTATMRYETN
jgi:Flp pilus assembly protein TadG